MSSVGTPPLTTNRNSNSKITGKLIRKRKLWISFCVKPFEIGLIKMTAKRMMNPNVTLESSNNKLKSEFILNLRNVPRAAELILCNSKTSGASSTHFFPFLPFFHFPFPFLPFFFPFLYWPSPFLTITPRHQLCMWSDAFSSSASRSACRRARSFSMRSSTTICSYSLYYTTENTSTL